jgi:hypothetical protein
MRAVLRQIARSACFVSPLFLIPIVALTLSLLGWIQLDSRVFERDILILNLLLYWALTAMLLAAILDARAVRAFVHSHRVRILIATIASGVSLLLAEAVARVVVERTEGFQLVPSPVLHHEGPPYLDIRDNTGSHVHTNGDGFRTSWTRHSFVAESQRVVVMGDSFVFGLGVDSDKTVPFFLERVLRDRLRKDDVAVLNAGVISYSPLLERSAFRHVVHDYKPTLTILLLDLGDIGDDYEYASQILPASDRDEPRFKTGEWPAPREFALQKLLEPILEPLSIPSKVYRRWSGLPRKRSGYLDFEVTVDGVAETDRWFILRHPLEKTRPFFEAPLSYIADTAGDVRASGSDFILFVAPRYFQWSQRECPNDWAHGYEQAKNPYLYAYFDFFQEASERVDFPIVSLLPAFKATDRFPLVLDNDAHWNEDGNRFVAETIADALLERGLVE